MIDRSAIAAAETKAAATAAVESLSRRYTGNLSADQAKHIASRSFGFTLLEVMIALLVIVLGIGAVINTTSESGWKAAQLKQKTIATWVAQNEISRYRSKRTWNSRSNISGDVEMANTSWHWEMKISKTDDPLLRRIDVDVYIKDEDGIKASLTGFIGRL